jgi:hypothetical protein
MVWGIVRHIRSAWPSSVGGEMMVVRGAFLRWVGMWDVAGLKVEDLREARERLCGF